MEILELALSPNVIFRAKTTHPFRNPFQKKISRQMSDRRVALSVFGRYPESAILWWVDVASGSDRAMSGGGCRFRTKGFRGGREEGDACARPSARRCIQIYGRSRRDPRERDIRHAWHLRGAGGGEWRRVWHGPVPA